MPSRQNSSKASVEVASVEAAAVEAARATAAMATTRAAASSATTRAARVRAAAAAARARAAASVVRVVATVARATAAAARARAAAARVTVAVAKATAVEAVETAVEAVAATAAAAMVTAEKGSGSAAAASVAVARAMAVRAAETAARATAAAVAAARATAVAARGRAAAAAAGWMVAAAAPVEAATRADALESSVAICCSIVEVTFLPKPHANTVTPSPLTSAAASTTVSNSVLPGAASTVCSPSERSSTILAAPTRGSPSSIPSKSCRTASKPSEIEVLPPADIASIPALITAASYDHGTRVVASAAKDTTEKRVASSPRAYWLTSFLAKAFDPLAPSIEPSGLGFFIEPLSSSNSAKSIGVAQEGMGGGGGDGGEGGGDGGGEGLGGIGGEGFRNSLIPAPPMRRRFGVPAALAFADSSSESTSAAARIISLTRATERVGSSASSWAATPETCGAAMLVPLIVLVAVLLEPTHAPRMPEPGACTHARWGSVRQGGQAGGRSLACGRWRAVAGGRTLACGRWRAVAGVWSLAGGRWRARSHTGAAR
eukprot:scaffold37630_cov56-Phaeocystis_antarctica.AAC.2